MSLAILSALLHAYIGWRIVPALAEPWAATAFATLLVVSAALMPFGLWARRIRSQPLSDRLAWAGLLSMGLFSSLLVLTLARDVLLLAAAAIAGSGRTRSRSMHSPRSRQPSCPCSASA